MKYTRSLDNLIGFIRSFLKSGNNKVNYELQVNALFLSLFLSPLLSMFDSRVFLSCSFGAKSEFNAEVNQPYEEYVML